MKDKNNFDKDIYDLIENMENLEELDFNFENIEEENLSSGDKIGRASCRERV